MSTFHVYDAGVGSGRPLASIALTENACNPSVRSVYCLGLVHAPYSSLSSLHSKVDPAFVEVKPKPAVSLFEGFKELDVMFVSGGVASTVLPVILPELS